MQQGDVLGRKKKVAVRSEYVCRRGDTVMSGGRKVYVYGIVSSGSNANREKAHIIACKIMPDNGQILIRNPKGIGSDWQQIA